MDTNTKTGLTVAEKYAEIERQKRSEARRNYVLWEERNALGLMVQERPLPIMFR